VLLGLERPAERIVPHLVIRVSTATPRP
jgi:hypothetical protein